MSARELITEHLNLWTGAVTQKSTRGRGRNSKIEQTGIKKLRDLILELAIRGKLVEQTSKDESAQVLTSKLFNAKDILISGGHLKKSRKLPDITEGESCISLPEGWVLARLGDIYDVRDGTHDTPKYQSSGYPLITSKNLSSGELSFDDIKLISETDHQKIQERSKVSKGDVLFAMIGSIGNPVIVNTDKKFSIKNVALFKYYSSELSNPHFLRLLLDNAVVELKNQAAGGVQPFVSLGKLRGWPVPFPPLAEQHRIVQKVDELMVLCDRLEQQTSDQLEAHETLVDTLLGTLTQSENATELADNWARLADHFDTLFTTEQSIDKLKQTILQLAVMGRLVEQNLGNQSAAQCLQQISENKEELVRQGIISKTKSLPSILKDQEPFQIPANWAWVRVWDVVDLITSGSRGWAKFYSETGASFITMGNLSRGTYNLRLKERRFVNPPNNSEGSRTKLQKGDLVVSITGDVGNLGLIPPNFGEAYINQHSCLVRFNEICRNRYMAEYMRSPLAKWQFDAPQRGIKNSFRLGDLGEMMLPLPPLEEQHRIVQKVDELMALCDQLKERLNQASETRCQLAEAVVDKALN